MQKQFEYEVIAVSNDARRGERKGFRTDEEAIREAKEMTKRYDTVILGMTLTDSLGWSNEKWLRIKVNGSLRFNLPESDNKT